MANHYLLPFPKKSLKMFVNVIESEYWYFCYTIIDIKVLATSFSQYNLMYPCILGDRQVSLHGVPLPPHPLH